jgi:hypothetical protein
MIAALCEVELIYMFAVMKLSDRNLPHSYEVVTKEMLFQTLWGTTNYRIHQ